MRKIVLLLVVVLSCGMLYGQKYSKKKEYSDGLAAVYFQERWGFVDKNDKLVINYAFEDVKPFNNGVAQVKYQGKWIYIDKKGKVTNAPQIAQNTSKSSSSSNYSGSSSSNNSNYSSSTNSSSQSNKSGSSSSSYSNTSSSSNSNKPSSSYSNSTITSSSNKPSSSSSYSSSSSKSTSSSSNSSSNKSSSSSTSYSSSNNKSSSSSTNTYVSTSSSSNSQTRELRKERDGFQWYYVKESKYVVGAQDKNGKDIIPTSKKFDYINYSYVAPYFQVWKYDEKKDQTYYGAYSIDGREIVPPVGFVEYDKDSDVFVYEDSDKREWYSIGVSLNSKGVPYMSNNPISFNSKYYDHSAFLVGLALTSKTLDEMSKNKANNSSNTSHSSNTSTAYSSSTSQSSSSSAQTAPILNADNLARGLFVGVTGTIIVKGIVNLFRDSSSSSSSSSSSVSKSSSTNNKPTPIPGRRSFQNVEVVRVKQSDSGWAFGTPIAFVSLRNKNAYSVVVLVQCRFGPDWPSDGSSFCKEVTVPAGEIREIDIHGPQGRGAFQDVRIISVR